MDVTDSDIRAFVGGLEPLWQRVYWDARFYARDGEDTSSHEWQLAAAVEQVFMDRVCWLKENAVT